jgi:hypothetical protein
MLNFHKRGPACLVVLIAPTYLDRVTHLTLQPTQRPDIIRVTAVADLERTDRHKGVADTRSASLPAVVIRDVLLNLGPKHAPHADRAHEGHVGQHGNGIKNHTQ